MKPRIGALLSHPIQYYSPWLAELARETDLTVYYAYRQTPQGQAEAGFSSAFDWDVPLLEGYEYRWLENVSVRPGLKRFDGCDTPEIAPIIAAGRFDAFLVLGWNRKSYLQAAWAAHRNRVPVLVRTDSQLLTRRSTWKKALKAAVYPIMLPRLGHYLSPGQRTDEYLRAYKVPEKQIHRLPHMVDVERFASGAEEARASGAREALRRRHGADEGDFVLLFVGKLIGKKRPFLPIEALAEHRRNRPGENLRLWVVGDGPLGGEMARMARQHDLPVSFLGFVNQSGLPAVYAGADCLVLPSEEETWGMVVNEAFACGLPAIVSAEVGCCPDLIEEGATGWALGTPSAKALAHLYLRAFTEAPSLNPEAFAAVSARHSYATGAQRLLSIVAEARPR